jgi:hypothetical protein
MTTRRPTRVARTMTTPPGRSFPLMGVDRCGPWPFVVSSAGWLQVAGLRVTWARQGHRAVPSTSSAGQRALSSRATSSHGIGLGPSSRSSRSLSPQSTKAET